MSLSVKGGAIALAGLILALLLYLGDLFLSLWVPWHLLPHPASQLSLAINFNATNVGMIQERFLEKTGIRYHNLSSLGSWASTVAYTQSESSSTIIVLPKLRYQRQGIARLTADGWHTRRIGPYIMGSLGPSDDVHLLKSLVQTTRSVVWDRNDRNPTLLAAIPKAPFGLDEPLFVMAITRGDTIVARISPTKIATPERSVRPPVESGASLFVEGSSVISMLSEPMIAEINNRMSQKAGFIHTKPKIIQSLLPFSHLFVVTNDSEVVIGGQGDPTLGKATLETLLQDEERSGRLQKQEFRLPDSTVGQEYIPGDRLPVWSEIGTDGCAQPQAERTHFWLCTEDNKFLMGTNKERLHNYLNDWPSTPFAAVDGSYLQSFPIPGAHELTVSWIGQDIDVMLQL